MLCVKRTIECSCTCTCTCEILRWFAACTRRRSNYSCVPFTDLISARRQHTEHSHTAPVLRAMASSQRLLSCNLAQSQPSARPSARPTAHRRRPLGRRAHRTAAAATVPLCAGSGCRLGRIPPQSRPCVGDCRGVEAPPSVSYRRSAGAAAGGRHRQRRWRPRRRLCVCVQTDSLCTCVHWPVRRH